MFTRISLFSLLAALCSPAQLLNPSTRQRDEDSEPIAGRLTWQEAASLRSSMRAGQMRIRTRTDGFMRQREVAISPIIVKLHQIKRIATIKLLLEITKQAKAEESRAAAVTAISLECGPSSCVGAVYWHLDTYDRPGPNDCPTSRQILLESVERSLANAVRERKFENMNRP